MNIFAKQCRICGNNGKYNERYDAYYCHFCNHWNEQKCKDNLCYYCKDRPEKPLGQQLQD